MKKNFRTLVPTGETEVHELAGKAKKKILVVNTSVTPTVVNAKGQSLPGHGRGYVPASDAVAKGAIAIGLLRVLSE